MEELNRNVSVTVGTDSTIVSEARNTLVNYRKFISIINTSTGGQVINLTFTDEAGAGKGVQLSVGGFYVESQDAGFTVTNSRISAISNIAGGTVAISERLVRID
jgi:hypothetical protein